MTPPPAAVGDPVDQVVASGATTPSQSETPVIRLDSVVVAFGGLVALDTVTLSVTRGERLAVLGPNGAGKTTLFNVIAGDIAPDSGRVWLSGLDCTRRPSRERPGLGLARTYQKTRLFPGLTVADNLYLAWTGKFGPRLSLRRRRGAGHDRARTAAVQVWLDGLEDRLVSDLSHGQQRQLEIGMALTAEPEVILLDEPASGLSRGERLRLVELIESFEAGITVIVIEHDMDVALRVADRVVVMADGKPIAHGSPDEIGDDPLVRAVYLGEHHDR